MTLPEDAHEGRGREPRDGHRIGPETPIERYPGGQLGRFRVVEVIHRGEMGTVVRAVDDELGREVALKVLPHALGADPQFQTRFAREADAVARLVHPAVCRLLSVGQQDGLLFVAMEFVHGETLARVIRTWRTFSVPGALLVVRTVAEALGAVHRAGLVHRDVTASNILVEADARIRLVDFGLTGFAFNPPSFAPHAYVGTPEYSSPEQCAGGDLDGRSDLYSLGVVLYEMLTGRVPFVDEDPVRLFRRVREESPIPIRALNPRVPRAVVAMFDRLTARDKGERYPDAAAVAAEADRLLAATPAPTSVIDLVRAEGPKTTRLRWVAAVLGIGAALAIGWGASRRPGPEGTPPTEREAARPTPPEVAAGAPAPPAAPSVGAERAASWKAVILPFRSVGGEAGFAWMSEGIPELLERSLCAGRRIEAIDRAAFLAAIGRVPGASAPPPANDVETWIGKPEVGAAMDLAGAEVLVAGRFTGDAERVRVEAFVRLSPVAAANPSSPVRTVAVEGPPTDLLALVDRLVRDVEALLRDRAQAVRREGDAG